METAALERFRPHVILLDVHLSDVDARDVVKQVKSSPDLQLTKVIAMSGKLTDGQVAHLTRQGFDAALRKPFSVRQVIDAIEAALGTPVQTVVKREDEQAFARANADNLMFCEDAARRVAAVVATSDRVARFDVTVSHFESLHAHDAVARVCGDVV